MLVVITSCALAFFISQNTVRAAESVIPESINPSKYGIPEPFMVQTLGLTWRGELRGRDVDEKSAAKKLAHGDFKTALTSADIFEYK